MTFKQVHAFKDHIGLYYNDQLLFRYVYMSDTSQREAPRPYFHPVCTLAGDVITNFRPHDHRWHTGISMTFAALSGQNFWGGPTYVDGQGYIQQDNNGSQQHQKWEDMMISEDHALLLERLTWVTQAGEAWIDELRRIRVSEVNPKEGYWCLDVDLQLRNLLPEPLVFGSPTTEGRPKAGYGGLFWRGPRDFTGGRIMVQGGAEANMDEDEIIGSAGRWLSFTGIHDGVDRASTLIFMDHPTNIRYPNKWFMRTKSFAAASFSFMYDEELSVDGGRELELMYRIVIANEMWSREQIDQLTRAKWGR